VPAGIDVPRVSAWLAEHVDGAMPPFTFESIGGGRSNLTFAVTGADGHRVVLRRPPLGRVLESAHDMGREHTIISAVGHTDVPVPTTLALCTDPDVNGAPFYVMSHVDGVVLDSPEKGRTIDADVRVRASGHLIDVLADLHAVDVDAVGLGGLAKRTGYIERQLNRWRKQWELSKTRDLPAIDDVAEVLARRVPEQVGVAIAHGDYRFGNCLIDPVSGRIAGVLDWELCTLGDPLADVGYLASHWADPGAPTRRDNDPTPAGGFPPFAELLERYAARTGRDVSAIDYYRAFASWRLAVITEGVYARYLHGAMGDHGLTGADLDEMRALPERLAEEALDAVRTG
jgi:aminoglycoside phosphotransferase (APT) family kinase protein